MQVGVLEARNRFSELVRRVASGATVTVTRHGQPIARLVPAAPEVTEGEVEALMADARALRSTAAFKTNWRENRRDRDEGRRF
jgi:prevent-host-death family protein